jgi:hypothetical protein
MIPMTMALWQIMEEKYLIWEKEKKKEVSSSTFI